MYEHVLCTAYKHYTIITLNTKPQGFSVFSSAIGLYLLTFAIWYQRPLFVHLPLFSVCLFQRSVHRRTRITVGGLWFADSASPPRRAGHHYDERWETGASGQRDLLENVSKSQSPKFVPFALSPAMLLFGKPLIIFITITIIILTIITIIQCFVS